MKKRIAVNQKKIVAFFQMLFLVPACAVFYTVFLGAFLTQLITLETAQWRHLTIALFLLFITIGIYAACAYLKKYGNLDL
jgi:hypothetical protein